MQSPSLPSRRLLLAGLVTLPLSTSSVGQIAAPSPTPSPTEDVPYVQTPPLLVRRMLQMAEVTPRDLLWDLGSGDGRIVIAAAKDFGARGVGYEIDSAMIRESRVLARKAGVNTVVHRASQAARHEERASRDVVGHCSVSSGSLAARSGEYAWGS